jgi:hypothetical protein
MHSAFILVPKDPPVQNHGGAFEVAAESVFQAAALAIAEFRRRGFTEAGIGPGTHLKVAVKAPATIHEVSFGRLEFWLQSHGKSPKEQALKADLRARIEQ